MTDIHSGSCACGGLKFAARGPLREVVACHCTQCRKQSGHYFAATNVTDKNLTIDDPDSLLTWYQSSAHAKRGFCSTCGSALFWKLDSDPHTSVLAGAFDTPTGFKLTSHIFVADKGDYYEIADGLPQFERSTGSVRVAGD